MGCRTTAAEANVVLDGALAEIIFHLVPRPSPVCSTARAFGTLAASSTPAPARRRA
jgi:hypothetical protein